jgi:hypothetical protein
MLVPSYRNKSETERTCLLCKELTTFNCECTPFVAGSRTPKGIPDRHFAHRRIPGGAFVEFKNPLTKLSPLQYTKIRSMRNRGTFAIVARFIDNGLVIQFETIKGEIVSHCDTDADSFLSTLAILAELFHENYS